MSLIKEFIVKGNAIDLAVGLVIGAAFGLMVTSLVKDVMMPPLGYVMGGIDFENKSIELAPALKAGEKHPMTQITLEKDLEAVEIRWGKFLNAVIALIIQGFCIFLVVKLINRMKRKEEEAPPAPPEPTKEEQLLAEIRDLLKTR